MVRQVVMSRLLCVFGLSLAVLAPVSPTAAASFDCAQASTPFENAICDSPELSAADERLALTYATAIGGLSDGAAEQVRNDQRDWLSYARRACTMDAEPLQSGTYDELGVSCLIDAFNGRSKVLEESRIVGGWRFYPVSQYDALPDPYEQDNPDSYYPVAQHERSMLLIDAGTPIASKFNDLVRADSEVVAIDAQSPDEDIATSDTTNSMAVEEVAGTGRITMRATTYWYGHGAAHGNWGETYLHYLTGEQRWVEAEDIFTGKRWRSALLDLVLEAAQVQHGDNLMLDGDTSYLADIVVNPARWELSDPYDLVIKFLPYEIAAYAYGTPEVRVPWEKLESYLAEGNEGVRYGN